MSGPLETYNHTVERFDAVARSAVWTLIAVMGTGVAALSLSINDRPEGLLLLAGSCLLGAYPFATWYFRHRRTERLNLDRLDDHGAALLQKASTSVARLFELVDTSPPGAVHDHVLVTALTAKAEVSRMYHQLATRPSHGDVDQVVAGLSQLERSVQDLVDMQTADPIFASDRPEPALLDRLAAETQELGTQLRELDRACDQRPLQ